MRYILFVLGIIIAVGLLFFVFFKKSSAPPTPQTTISPQQRAISQGETPAIPFTVPQGYTIHIFARGLGTPRDLQFSPQGTLLVSNPQANDVIALPDANHDGVADEEKVIVHTQPHAHGLAFFKSRLYLADVRQVVSFAWNDQTLSTTDERKLFSLPTNNDHNNRTIVFDKSGNMYVSVGSTCNVCWETPEQGGSVWISNANGTNPRVFATGLRNAAFLSIHPTTDALWGTEMGRDYLGDTLPPDEINSIQQGKNYGWPNCYGDKIHDVQFDKQSYNPCTTTQSPIFQIPAHSAPLGLTFIHSSQFPPDWQDDLLVAYHGSWNRSTPTGYKIVHMKVRGNAIVSAEDFLTGFLQNGQQFGRPVDLAFDAQGNLFISDDKSGTVYILQKK